MFEHFKLLTLGIYGFHRIFLKFWMASLRLRISLLLWSRHTKGTDLLRVHCFPCRTLHIVPPLFWWQSWARVWRGGLWWRGAGGLGHCKHPGWCRQVCASTLHWNIIVNNNIVPGARLICIMSSLASWLVILPLFLLCNRQRSSHNHIITARIVISIVGAQIITKIHNPLPLASW